MILFSYNIIRNSTRLDKEDTNIDRILENFYNNDPDLKQAFFWYKKSADQGNTNAQFQLGNCYYEGHGTQRNQKEAIFWFKESSDRGHQESKKILELIDRNSLFSFEHFSLLKKN